MDTKLLQQQQEACDRMMSALHDVIRQEQEVRKRVEAKKQRLVDLQQQRERGYVNSSEVEQKKLQLSVLNDEIVQLELAYKYHISPVAHRPLPPEVEMSADAIPPPLPPRYQTSNRVPLPNTRRVFKEVGPDQWLCVCCTTVNSNVMPICAECSK